MLLELVDIIVKNPARHIHGLTKLYAVPAEVFNLSEGKHTVVLDPIIMNFREASLIMTKTVQLSIPSEIFIVGNTKL